MTTFIKNKFKKSDNQTNIDKYRVAVNITEYDIRNNYTEIEIDRIILTYVHKLINQKRQRIVMLIMDILTFLVMMIELFCFLKGA